jgi:hypothetical protein
LIINSDHSERNPLNTDLEEFKNARDSRALNRNLNQEEIKDKVDKVADEVDYLK